MVKCGSLLSMNLLQVNRYGVEAMPIILTRQSGKE